MWWSGLIPTCAHQPKYKCSLQDRSFLPSPLGRDSFSCGWRRPGRQSSPLLPPSLLIFPYKGWPDWSPTARNIPPSQPSACQDALFPKRGPSNSFNLSLGEWPRLPSTARIGRAQLHRARSASTEGTWLLPLILLHWAWCEAGWAGQRQDPLFFLSGISPFLSGISPQLSPSLPIINPITFIIATH